MSSDHWFTFYLVLATLWGFREARWDLAHGSSFLTALITLLVETITFPFALLLDALFQKQT